MKGNPEERPDRDTSAGEQGLLALILAGRPIDRCTRQRATEQSNSQA